MGVEGILIMNRGELKYNDFSVAAVCVRLLQHWYVPDLVVATMLAIPTLAIVLPFDENCGCISNFWYI